MIAYLTRLIFFRKTRLFSCLLFPAVLLSYRSSGQCSVTSSLSGTSFSNNTTVGGSSWASLGNVALSDNGRASNGILLGVLSSQNTHYIVIKNFGFAIPSAASICGIEVSIERRATGLLIGSSVTDNSISLVKNNMVTGTNMASSDNWPGSDASRAYGSMSETWGTGWTPEDINSADFGVAISARLSSGLAGLFLTAEIDQVTIRVFFNVVLPVQLSTFRAVQQDEKVHLEWSTASEYNNHHFTIERSPDGATHWKSIDSISGAGNSNTTQFYSLTDYTPLPVGYYRLKQIDITGHPTYSKIVSTRLYSHQQLVQVYPNPATSNNEITVLFPGVATRIVIEAVRGEEIVVKNYYRLSGGVKLKLPKIRNGYYWLVIQTADSHFKQQLLVL